MQSWQGDGARCEDEAYGGGTKMCVIAIDQCD